MTMPLPIPAEVREWARSIEKTARSVGLDFPPVFFEMVTYQQMNMLAAYDGFPIRYRHWKWGAEYERISKSYTYGLSKIYELVINTDPCYAYLLEPNSLLEHKLVIAHVYAHGDFFKNNAWFTHTDRKMLDQMANHASKISRIAEAVGQDKVENFIDICLTIDNLIDPYAPHIMRKRPAGEETALDLEPARLPARSYMDRYINPESEIERKRDELKRQHEELRSRLPAEPERDVMAFLLEHAPLERWQQQILSMMRDESYYFVPQRMTKIMNEGWASYWHSKILTQHGVCHDGDILDFCSVHSATMAMSPNSINPYKIGLELYRDIEERWNKGRFGLEWERCENMDEKLSWDKQLGLGRDKIFQTRKIYNDLMFIDEFLTPDFAERLKLFSYGFNKKHEQWEIKTREFLDVKAMLMKQLTNFGQPMIYVEDANYKNRGELLLWHKFDGQDLKGDYARETLQNLVSLWSRPVHIRTVSESKQVIWSHDGTRFEETRS